MTTHPDQPDPARNADFHNELLLALMGARDSGALRFESRYNKPIASGPGATAPPLPDPLPEIYRQSDGIRVRWKALHVEQAYGGFEFPRSAVVLSDWADTLFEPEELEIDDRLLHFAVFDQVSPELSCGLPVDPDDPGRHVYLHVAAEGEITALPVDLDGYLTMLVASRAYKNWPLLLLELEDDRVDLPNSLARHFRADMPRLFPDFDWERYTATYRSVRLP